jgi:hypothetical protein
LDEAEELMEAVVEVEEVEMEAAEEEEGVEEEVADSEMRVPPSRLSVRAAVCFVPANE